jgi:hypothetical protein
MKYDVHEYATLFPPMQEEEYKTLVESIRTYGLRDKIVLFEGKILDGRHRDRACEETGQKKEYEEFKGTRPEALNFVFLKNANRRHLSSSQLAAVAVEKEELLLTIEKENQQAKMASIPQQSQKGWQSSVPQKIAEHSRPRNYERETTAQIAKIVGTNRQYIKDARMIRGSFPDRHEQIKRGLKTISEVKKEIHQAERERIRKEMDEAARKSLQSKPVKIEIYQGDCLELSKSLPDNSLDGIITDLPYAYEHLNCWSKLSLIGSQKLKPGGFCIAYTGKMFLNEVMRRMDEHLEYFWTITLLHKGPFNTTYPRSVENRYKPILIYIKPPIADNLLNRRKEHFIDVLQGTGREKSDHEWQQAEDELTYLFEKFTQVGDTILDPFAGSGTTLAMAQKMQRHAIGFELDEKYIPIIKQMLGLEDSHE